MSDPQENITPLLKKNYIWDIEIKPGKPVPERLIVERIFSFGTLEEAALVIRYFGRKKVEDFLVHLNYLDPKTLNFVSKFFGIPKKDFKCYTKRQSEVQHWDY